MDDIEYRTLMRNISHIFCTELNNFIESHSASDEFLHKIKSYLNKAKMTDYTWDIEKAEIVLAVLQLKNRSDVEEILSYLNQSSCGWQGHTYQSYNRCMRFDQRCRRNYKIDNDPNVTARAFSDIDKIFLHKEYGAITAYLFGYSLSALFSSRLKKQHKGIPYFLQIACKRNSNTYRLMHEIVQICDVNTGLFEHCNGFDYGDCNHNHMILNPTDRAEKLLDSLIYYRDIPVIVEGYENEKLYATLLRETANIPGKTKRLDLKAKFNVLPIFLCSVIQSQFHNVFSMDLTNLDIEDEYIELVLKNKQRLGSWAFELVTNAKSYFNVGNSTAYSSRSAIQKLIELRNPEDEIPLFYDLDDSINLLRTKCGQQTRLNSKDVTNIGYLMYFISYYMKVFRRSIRLSEGTKFIYRMSYRKHNITKLVEIIFADIFSSLLKLHTAFAPTRLETINIDIDSSNAAEAKRIKRKGSAYAKDIVRYYQSYGVSIWIESRAEYKDSRYVFSIKLMPGTNVKLISRYAEEVRRQLEVEVLTPDVMPNSIKLIVAEKPLNENSLTKILESTQFKESDMEIPYAVGYDILGEMVVSDLAEFPHLLIGGTSGSGKSSAIHSLLMSIIYKQPADKVKLLLLDFGASGLKMFDKIPHMLRPTIRTSEIERGRQCILWLQREMEDRLKKKELLDERIFIKESKRWPSIICVIDEFPVFIRQLTDGRGNKKSHTVIEDLLARARKVKIHLILAAQDTTQNGIGISKTNLAAGIAFRCTNWHNSQAVIGGPDAVNLFGKGSMYFKCEQHEGLRRLQGSYMPPEEIMDMLDTMDFTKNNDGKRYNDVTFIPRASQGVTQSENFPTTCDPQISGGHDEQLLIEILKRLRDDKKDSISNKWLKDEFEMGYDRANRFLQLLEDAEIISKLRIGTKLPRAVNQDALEKFLKNYGCTEGAIEQTSSQTLDTSDVSVHMEPIPEQVVESMDERALDRQEYTAESSVVSQSKPPKKI